MTDFVAEQLKAQSLLEVTLREYITQLSIQLRSAVDSKIRDNINAQLAVITPQYYRVLGKDIAIKAARSQEDLDIINKVSTDITSFIYNIAKIEAMVGVATSIIKFVVICLDEKQNPVSIYKAGKEVYDAMNAVIDNEKDKGTAAAILIPAPIAVPMAIMQEV